MNVFKNLGKKNEQILMWQMVCAFSTEHASGVFNVITVEVSPLGSLHKLISFSEHFEMTLRMSFECYCCLF